MTGGTIRRLPAGERAAHILDPHAPPPPPPAEAAAPTSPSRTRETTNARGRRARRRKEQATARATQEHTARPPRSVVRPIRFTSFYFLRRATRVWELLLLSLLVDPLLFEQLQGLPQSETLTTYLTHGLAIAFLIALLALASNQVLNLFERGRSSMHLLTDWVRSHPWFIAVVVVMLASAEGALRTSTLSGAASGVVTLLMALVALLSMRRTQTESRQTQEEFAKDRVRWVEHLNRQYFLLALAPLVASRLVSLCGVAHAALIDQEVSHALGWVGMAGVLLALHRPVPEQFVAPCGGCTRPTSRALSTIGHCPACLPGLLDAQHPIWSDTSLHRLPSSQLNHARQRTQRQYAQQHHRQQQEFLRDQRRPKSAESPKSEPIKANDDEKKLRIAEAGSEARSERAASPSSGKDGATSTSRRSK